MSDLISRQAAIDALHMHLMYRMGTDSNKKQLDDWINSLPSAQGKPFNLPEIYIADGYDTIEGEDGNVGFGVYVPDENQIYVAGDVEGEIRARALLHEICHWVQAMCGRPFDEDEANEFSDIVYDALPSAQETHEERTETHACDCISRQAAIDAVCNDPSIQPKTGHWVKVTNGRGGHECDLCHEYAPSYQSGEEHLTNYCPNCGAKMIEQQGSEE